MIDNENKNLSETLFKKNKQASETSDLTLYMPSSAEVLKQKRQQDGYAWYRHVRRLQWAWQGIDPIEQESVLAHIARSDASRTTDQWLDTVIGYRSGNWNYEWTRLGMQHQSKANELEGDASAEELFSAALCFSIAGYPHLKNDSLAIQAQVLASNSYAEAAKRSRYVIKKLEFPYQNRKIIAHLHMKNTDEPHPVVIVCAGLDSLQTDVWCLFRDYFVKRNIAMLTIDMPSMGNSAHWPLGENSSCLHQEVLNQLHTLPWIDHNRVGLIGFRFGGNAMARLSFLEQDKIRACVVTGAPIHDIFTSHDKLHSMPKMYLDVLASRLGKRSVDIDSLAGQLRAWSLKEQGFLRGRKTKVPILAIGLEGDPVAPHSDNKLLAMYSQHGVAKQISSKTITQGYEQSLDLAINWLQEQLFK